MRVCKAKPKLKSFGMNPEQSSLRLAPIWGPEPYIYRS